MCVVTAYGVQCLVTACGVQCLVTGCRGSSAEQLAVSPGRGMLHYEVVQHPSSWTNTHQVVLVMCKGVTHGVTYYGMNIHVVFLLTLC